MSSPNLSRLMSRTRFSQAPLRVLAFFQTFHLAAAFHAFRSWSSGCFGHLLNLLLLDSIHLELVRLPHDRRTRPERYYANTLCACLTPKRPFRCSTASTHTCHPARLSSPPRPSTKRLSTASPPSMPTLPSCWASLSANASAPPRAMLKCAVWSSQYRRSLATTSSRVPSGTWVEWTAAVTSAWIAGHAWRYVSSVGLRLLVARARMEGVTVCCCFASGHKGMISVVRRTGHSSYYVEKGMNAMGKTPKQLGIQTDYKINGGG